MSNIHFDLVDLFWKMTMKCSKNIEENCYMSSYDIVKELNIKLFWGICIRLDTQRSLMFGCYMI